MIQQLRKEKGWGRKRLMTEFPNKKWKKSSLGRLLKKIDETGGTDRKSGSGRPRTTRIDKNIEIIEDLVLSQEEASTHDSSRTIERNTGISRSSVRRIIKEDLKLDVFKRMKVQKSSSVNKERRELRARRLLQQNLV